MMFPNEDDFRYVSVFCSDYYFQLHYLICKLKTTPIFPQSSMYHSAQSHHTNNLTHKTHFVSDFVRL